MTERNVTDPLRLWFERYCAIAEGTRTKWLEAQTLDSETRQELLALIAAAERAGNLDRPVGEWFLSLEQEQEDDLSCDQLIGQTIGDYRLVRQIGIGGMGAVYLGERVAGDFKQQAALKLFNRPWYSRDQAELFRRERQILASLSHANIAHLLDAGVTENNISFLVMEYVEGSTIDVHCCKAALSVVQRLKLMQQVCLAVANAHVHLVVHRDIKPSNVMVNTQGEVKLLDFGIAKLLDQDTQTLTGKGIMTFLYAAPEQRNGGRITTATDVYALGVLMHELLVGKRPDFANGNIRASQLAVKSKEHQFQSGELPAHPKQLAQVLRGDLDTILQRALEVEPARRYPTAQALAEDIERYLNGQAVLAHPPSGWYLARKFVARHRGSVTLTALLVLGIVLSLILALQQAARATKAAAIATAQTERAEVVRDFLIDVMGSAADDLPRDERPSAAQMATQAQAKLSQDPSMPPDVRLDLLLTFADINLTQREFSAAQNNLTQAEPLLSAGLDDNRVRWLRLDAQRLVFEGKSKEAAELLRPITAVLSARASALHADTLQTLAFAEWDLRAMEQTLALLKIAARQYHDVLGPDHLLSVKADMYVGSHHASVQQWQAGESVLTPLVAKWRKLQLPNNAHFAATLNDYGYTLIGLGRAQEARAALEESLVLRRTIFTAPHDRIANSLSALGQVELDIGNYPQSVKYRQESLDTRMASFPAEHPLVIVTQVQLSASQIMLGELEKAEKTLGDADRSCQIQDFAHPYCVLLPQMQTRLLIEQQQLPQAKAMAKKSLALSRNLHGVDSPELARPYLGLALVYSALGEEPQAMSALNEAMARAGQTGAAAQKQRIIKILVLDAFQQDADILLESEAMFALQPVPVTDPHDLAKLWIVRIDALRRQKMFDALPSARAALEKISAPYLPARWQARREQALQAK